MRQSLVRSLFFLLFMSCLISSYGQNLLANGSFEDLNSCFEYQRNCSPSAWFVVMPTNPKYIKPVEGFRTLPFFFDNIYSPVNRTFPYSRILCPLQAKNRYRLSLWVNPGIFSFSHFDVFLTEADPSRIRTAVGHYSLSFQFGEPDIALKEKNGWLFLSKEFDVDSEKNFILLGNLSNHETYSNNVKKNAKNTNGDITYWIDDIKLVSSDTSKPYCPQYSRNKKLLYSQNHRHTPNIYLDGNELTPRSLGKNEDTADFYTNIVKTDTLLLPDLLFKTNSSNIDANYKAVLDSVVAKIIGMNLKQIEINGFTDNEGSDQFNLILSLRRAETVKNYISFNSPKVKEIISSNGYGIKYPIVPNTSAENRARNRRVQIVLFY